MYKKNIFKKNIEASSKFVNCDIVIENISIVDVFQAFSFKGNVAIKNGYIVGIGDFKGDITIDGSGKFICPSLIDAHTHIESSLLSPEEYLKVALLHGVTSIIADPHEIANVMGIDGINFMLKHSYNVPFDFYFMLPSCVPATSFETSGAKLDIEDLKPFYENKKVLGLAEVMDYPSVLNRTPSMINKIYDSLKLNKSIDGHCAGFDNHLINVYATARITTDHESISIDEMNEKIRRGMYVFMREGTAAKNLRDLIKGVTESNSRRICLCTDDKHVDEFVLEGSIDNSIRICIENNIRPEVAIQMATLNTAQCYNIPYTGAIAPGYKANFIILDNLEKFKINSVYKDGTLVVKDNTLVLNLPKLKGENKFKNTVKFKELIKDDFIIDIENKHILNCIEIIPNKLETNHLKISLDQFCLSNRFESLVKEDLIKLAVIERHKATGNISLAVIKGLNLKSGALATTIAHDSHNLIVCGVNDDDMILASNELKRIGGGIVVALDGKIVASISLEVGGLITTRPIGEVLEDMKKLHSAIDKIAPDITFNIFLTISFLSLPVIPDIKITDKGLFDVKNFKFIDLVE